MAKKRPPKPTGKPRKPKDGFIPIKHMRFLQAIALGSSAARAYKMTLAGKTTTMESCKVNACRLLREHAHYRLTLAGMKHDMSQHLTENLHFDQTALADWLVDGITTPVGEITKDHQHASEILPTKEGTKIKMSSKTELGKMLMDLAGWTKEKKVQVTHSASKEVTDAMDKLFGPD